MAGHVKIKSAIVFFMIAIFLFFNLLQRLEYNQQNHQLEQLYQSRKQLVNQVQVLWIHLLKEDNSNQDIKKAEDQNYGHFLPGHRYLIDLQP